jgi:probable addiction module antidote protein
LLKWLKASHENQIEYLKSSVEENSDMPEAILAALRDIAEVRGFEKLAHDAALSQKSLYKILKTNSKPRLETIHQILHALGLRLTIEPIPKGQKVALG